MKNKLCNIVYFVFLWALYIFLRTHSQEMAFEMLAHSYSLFLQALYHFSYTMSTKGWERLF